MGKGKTCSINADEVKDYKRKDSLEIVRKDPRYMDSLDKKRNEFRPLQALLFEQTFTYQRSRTTFSFRPLTELVGFNPAEGFYINPDVTWTKRLDTTSFSRKSIAISPVLRYGFTNKHFNAHLAIVYKFGKTNPATINFSGGKRVFQFFNNSPVGQRGNSISSLLSEDNRIKSYEAVFLRGSYRQAVGNGLFITTTSIRSLHHNDKTLSSPLHPSLTSSLPNPPRMPHQILNHPIKSLLLTNRQLFPANPIPQYLLPLLRPLFQRNF